MIILTYILNIIKALWLIFIGLSCFAGICECYKKSGLGMALMLLAILATLVLL